MEGGSNVIAPEFKLQDEEQEIEAIRQLEDDFNDGESFDLGDYKAVLEAAHKMGFPKSEMIEAVQVLDSEDLIELTKYVFLEEDEKKKVYKTRVANAKNGFRLDHTDLIEEIRRLQADLLRETEKTKELNAENNRHSENVRLEYYTEFLRAIISDDVLSKEHLDSLKVYQTDNNISGEEHTSTLQKLSVSPGDWKSLVEDASVAQTSKGRGDNCVFPCMHCISEAQAQKATDKCPVCRETFDKIEKIFL